MLKIVFVFCILVSFALTAEQDTKVKAKKKEFIIEMPECTPLEFVLDKKKGKSLKVLIKKTDKKRYGYLAFTIYLYDKDSTLIEKVPWSISSSKGIFLGKSSIIVSMGAFLNEKSKEAKILVTSYHYQEQ